VDRAAGLSNVEPLGRQHDLSRFDCGTHKALNDWLTRYAVINQANESTKTYVVHRDNIVVGYYSISAGSVSKQEAVPRAGKGLANHPIPVAVLTRLAVDRGEQGKGLGKALLKDALLRIEQAANILGIRAALVHAIDETAGEFYKKYDFEECPGSDLHLMLLMKDLRAMLR
jgi:GNAT superfamily N-acetyltransferase